MKIKCGDLIKLNNYAGHAGRTGQYGQVLSSGAGEALSFRWISDNVTANTTRTNVKGFRPKKISDTIGQTLEVGMEIITNANGSQTREIFYKGKIGEILANAEGKNTAFIWNNKHQGTDGNVTRPTCWQFTDKIKLIGTNAKIIVIGDAQYEMPEDQDECANCGHLFDEDELEEACDGDLYCEECLRENFVHCESCNDQIEVDDSRSSEDGLCYCESCYDDIYFHCHACGEEYANDDACTGSDDRLYCNDCFNERFGTCSECDHTERNDDLYYDEENDQYLCDDCRGVHDEDTGERVIHDYGYRPEPKFFKIKHELEDDIEKPVYMGVELEVQREFNHKDYSQKFIKFLKEQGTEKYYYLKHDGSLEDKGFEIVTHPFTLQYAHKNLGFNKILTWLEENKLNYGNVSGKCGLHVHIGRTFFEELDITKLRLFFKQSEKELKKFSRRNGTGDHYCQFETTTVKDIIAGEQPSGRYWALNLESSRETVEIRIFRGDLNKDWFIAVLQFVDAISNFVKKHGITSFIYGEGVYHKNSWKLFTDWAQAQQKYGAMLKYMKGEKLCV